jgi:hypothetical protein
MMCYQTRLDYSQAIKKPLPVPSQLDFPHHSQLAGLVAAPILKGRVYEIFDHLFFNAETIALALHTELREFWKFATFFD